MENCIFSMGPMTFQSVFWYISVRFGISSISVRFLGLRSPFFGISQSVRFWNIAVRFLGHRSPFFGILQSVSRACRREQRAHLEVVEQHWRQPRSCALPLRVLRTLPSASTPEHGVSSCPHGRAFGAQRRPKSPFSRGFGNTIWPWRRARAVRLCHRV